MGEGVTSNELLRALLPLLLLAPVLELELFLLPTSALSSCMGELLEAAVVPLVRLMEEGRGLPVTEAVPVLRMGASPSPPLITIGSPNTLKCGEDLKNEEN